MNAFILAAGFGKRMGDLTRSIPKPMLPVNGYPLVYYTLYQLYRWGTGKVTINLHYRGSQLKKSLANFPHFEICWSEEEEILGTAGALRKALGVSIEPGESLVLMNSDCIYFSGKSESPVSLKSSVQSCLYMLPRQANSIETGWVFIPGQAGKVEMQPNGGDYYYSGIGVIDPAIVQDLLPGKKSELGPLWVDQASKKNVEGKILQGSYYSCGIREEYERLKNTDVMPGELRDRWRAFLSGWAT